MKQVRVGGFERVYILFFSNGFGKGLFVGFHADLMAFGMVRTK
jgi:hypothetical protein